MARPPISIVSLPDKDELVAELYQDDDLWAEISQEKGHFEIEIYPCPNGGPWGFALDEVIYLLSHAKRELAGETYIEK
ncbi:MAG: hypothetical protein ACRDIB_13465 [Ardenticatenaceae bacterium]